MAGSLPSQFDERMLVISLKLNIPMQSLSITAAKKISSEAIEPGVRFSDIRNECYQTKHSRVFEDIRTLNSSDSTDRVESLMQGTLD